MSSRVGSTAAIVTFLTSGAGGCGSWPGCPACCVNWGQPDRAAAEGNGKTAAIDASRFRNSLRVVSEKSSVRGPAAAAAAVTAKRSLDEIDVVRFLREGGR